jgi:hypothetical protein
MNREHLATVFRNWIHEQPFSKCNMGSDTCPDWDMAYELADLADLVAGLVAEPPCKACKGTGKVPLVDEARHDTYGELPCPRCDGSGHARMVALDDVVEWLRARPACGTLARYENHLADELERRFSGNGDDQ